MDRQRWLYGFGRYFTHPEADFLVECGWFTARSACCQPKSDLLCLSASGKSLVVFVVVESAGKSTPDMENVTITKDWQRESTPEGVLLLAKEGNKRFRTGNMYDRDFLHDQKKTAGGQYPVAAILGCIDSRVPAEIVFDAGIGDLVNARVAGNVLNPDILGSLEFACKVAGARLIIVLGHTNCGAVAGALDGVALGNLTGLLDKIQPAIKAIGKFDGDRSSKNKTYVDAVARKNVQLTVERIRKESPVLSELEKAGSLLIVGAMYAVDSGSVIFLD